MAENSPGALAIGAALAAAFLAPLASASGPQRVVTLMPSLAELAAELLGPSSPRLVGVVERSEHPAWISRIPSVGAYPQVNLERVMALKPDLVVASTDGNSQDQIQHLKELGLNVQIVSTASLSEVERSIRSMGALLGEDVRARSVAERFHRDLESIRLSAAKKPKRRVMLQLGDDPLVVAGKGSFLDEAIRWVGGENVYGDSPMHYPKPSTEDVVRRDPDVLVLVDFDGNPASTEKMRRRWLGFRSMKAVSAQRVREFRGDELLRPTPGLVTGLRQLEKAVHGDR